MIRSRMLRTGHVLWTGCALWTWVLLAALLGGCTRPAPVLDREARLAALDSGARMQFARLEQEHLLRRDARVIELGDQLLATYPDHPLAAEAMAMMFSSALRLPEPGRAGDIARAFVARFAGDQRLEPILEAAADGFRDGELQALAAELAGTPLGPALQARLQRRGLGAAVAPAVAPRAEPGRIGVLAPLTGRYARFGNAFLAGVRMAAAAVPPPADRPWRIVHEDTEGDVVAAALAARRLVGEEASEILIGALLSTTTATVALVADHLGVPLVSPTATHERLSLLGDEVLQTNRTGPLEAEILARLACEVLLKERFAIIRSETAEGLDQAEAFRAAVARYGGRIVHEEVFDPAATDYRAQVERLRAARPEVVFAQATVDQMILLGPQLDFYRVGALVLGPSDWNSGRLLQRAGSVMERAIFPAGDVMYPAPWTAAFLADWPAGQYDEEATRIARGAYLATRMVLQALAEAGPGQEPGPIIAGLRAGFLGRGVELDAVEAYSAMVRTIEDGQITAFPGQLYAEAMRRRALAAAAAAPALVDSLVAGEPAGAAADSTR